jgi:hypothetical protein
MLGAVIIYYGCTEHTNGPKIIFEISKIKIPLSMQNLPGFIMKLDTRNRAAYALYLYSKTSPVERSLQEILIKS